MKTLILTWQGFQDQEVIYPYHRLREEGTVDIMANVVGPIKGILGVTMDSSFAVAELNDKASYADFLARYDMLVIPGGVKALEKLRQERVALQFVYDWNAAGKTIASTCHGAQLMISAKVVEGRKISGYYSIRDDIQNAGATYVDAPAVTAGNIVSSPHYKWMAEWLQEAVRVYDAA